MAAADGKWNLSWKPGRGSRAATVELAVAGSDITGSYDESLGGNPQPIAEGSADGDRVSWKVTVQEFAGPMTMTFAAKVEGNRMEGTIETPQDSIPFSGARA